MNKIVLAVFFLGVFHFVTAQDVQQLHETARSFIREADYSNAILVLNRALQIEPQNMGVSKDLALSYYLQKDYTKALETIKPVIESDEANDQCYQIAGDIYLIQHQFDDCEKTYKKGIKKFPQSGALYNALGEVMQLENDNGAIKQWEKGIESDPGFAKNYFNACKYYYASGDWVWAALYGEIYINLNPLSLKSAELKTILLETYKKLFTYMQTVDKEKNAFVQAFLSCIYKQSAVASQGINPESLTMIRSRFILDWYANYQTKYPVKLFGLQRQLLQEGLFDAYNQWIFGAAQNLSAYQRWITTHETDYADFNRFQKNVLFKIPSGEYYH